MPLRFRTPLISYRRGVILLVQIALIPLAYLLAFALRFDFNIPAVELAHFRATLPYLLGIRFLTFQGFGLHQGYWRHVGLRDLVDLLLAVTLSSALFVSALALLQLWQGMPRSVFILDWVFMIFLSGGIRFAARTLSEGRLSLASPEGTGTLIIGAGEAGEKLLGQTLHDPGQAMDVGGPDEDNPGAEGQRPTGRVGVGGGAQHKT